MRLKIRVFALPALLVLAAGVPARVAPRARTPLQRPPRARKVDEFGRRGMGCCDAGARLDNFAIELQNEPGSTGYVLAYESAKRAPGTARLWGEELRNYLIEVRALEESRVFLVNAGRHDGDDLKIEFWLVPQGAEPPAAARAEEKKEARPFSGEFDELGVFDDTRFYDTEGCGEAGAYEIGITYAAFAKLLKQQPDSQGYIVVYSKPGSAPGYWRRVGTREQQKLAGDGLGAERLTIVNGGEVEVKKGAKKEEDDEQYGRVEFWVGEKGRPPVRDAPENGRLKEALLVGTSASFAADDEKINDWVLANLADVLRADKRSVGCIIVFPGDGNQLITDADGVEKPPPDIFKLAEGWQAELAKKYGVEVARLVLMHGPPDEAGLGKIEAWAMPEGAAMPDPFAKKD